MRAWQVSEAFGIDRLELQERPDLALGPGEVRVRVRAVALNYRDVLMVDRGVAPRGVQLPLLPCSDAAGEVVEIGSGVSRVKPGDRVATNLPALARRRHVAACRLRLGPRCSRAGPPAAG